MRVSETEKKKGRKRARASFDEILNFFRKTAALFCKREECAQSEGRRRVCYVYDDADEINALSLTLSSEVSGITNYV